MTKKARRKAPQLRFSEFNGDWKTDRSDHFLIRYVNPVEVQLDTQYEQIGIRSHGKGIFHKEPVTGRELGNKRVYWVHPEAFTVNIVFAWEQAVALTSNAEKGFIASHRFLMFLPKENRVDLKFILLFFLRKRGKSLLELASPGGAGRNKTLGQDNFAELQLTLPNKEEQEKIASFLGAVDTRLTQLRRKHKLLQTYKRGVMQKIFSQQIRFKCDRGKPFPDWEMNRIDNFLVRYNNPVDVQLDAEYSQIGIRSHGKGIFHKEPVTGRDLGNKRVYWVHPRSFVINIVFAWEQAVALTSNEEDGFIASHRFLMFLPKNNKVNLQFVLLFFLGNRGKSLLELASPGGAGRNKTLGQQNFSELQVTFPTLKEQEQIADFMTAIDQKIEAIAKQIELTEQFKKGLLQKMFV